MSNNSNISSFTVHEINQINNKLDLTDNKIFTQNVEHFTEGEGKYRDQIVEGYFGKEGMEFLINKISENISENLRILDLGVGAGTFFLPIVSKTTPKIAIGLDITPKMLELLIAKTNGFENLVNIQVVLGDIENIKASLEVNSDIRSLRLPTEFDIIISTLALHHITDTSKVFEEISMNLSKEGSGIVVDSIKSANSKESLDPGHAHNGFELDKLENLGYRFFNKVQIELLDLKCDNTGGDSDGNQMFLLVLSDPK